jgi:hypothetical protein
VESLTRRKTRTCSHGVLTGAIGYASPHLAGSQELARIGRSKKLKKLKKLIEKVRHSHRSDYEARRKLKIGSPKRNPQILANAPTENQATSEAA